MNDGKYIRHSSLISEEKREELVSQFFTFSKKRLIMSMSAFTSTNTSFEPGPEMFGDEIQIVTFCEIGLSIVTMFANLANFFLIRQNIKTTFVYQIQQIDSIVTAVSQIGWVGILLSSISDAPNAYICTPATALALLSGCHFALSNLLMVIDK